MESNEIEKIARTEALFREVNERIAETAARFDATQTNFVCECADPRCTHRVEATLEQYERVEAVVRQSNDHAVVEKQHPIVRRLVLALDPRAA